jgi:hypothetical protein
MGSDDYIKKATFLSAANVVAPLFPDGVDRVPRPSVDFERAHGQGNAIVAIISTCLAVFMVMSFAFAISAPGKAKYARDAPAFFSSLFAPYSVSTTGVFGFASKGWGDVSFKLPKDYSITQDDFSGVPLDTTRQPAITMDTADNDGCMTLRVWYASSLAQSVTQGKDVTKQSYNGYLWYIDRKASSAYCLIPSNDASGARVFELTGRLSFLGPLDEGARWTNGSDYKNATAILSSFNYQA